MSARVVAAVIGGLLLIAKTHLTVAAAGQSVTIPGPVIAAAAVAAACAVVAWLIIRALHGLASCPHLHLRSTA